MTPDPPNAAQVLTVSRYLAGVRLTIERTCPVRWIAGEICNLFRASSGHVYFDLRDATAQARCTLWRQKAQLVGFSLRNGLAVEVRAAPTLYEAKGDFQLNVDAIREAGQGTLYERFVRLKERLAADGWFASERKRPLPPFPRSVGIVTSPRGAAVRDVITTLRRRWPASRVIVYPSAVQGAAAAAEVAQSIRLASARRETDVLIVCRGGGSIEDLWAFNEERVARAILDCAMPVITGIGHETDFTIADFVADVRAPTPTGAAAIAVPDRVEHAQRLDACARRLSRAASHGLHGAAVRVDAASRRLVHPAKRLAAQRNALEALSRRMDRTWQRERDARRERLDGACARLCREMRAPLREATVVSALRDRIATAGARPLERTVARIGALAQHLAHLDPTAVLQRGYAIVTDTKGAIVQDANALEAGDLVDLRFARGAAEAIVRSRR